MFTLLTWIVLSDDKKLPGVDEEKSSIYHNEG